MHNPDSNRWLLPDGFDEILPPDAREVELLRQRILGLYHSWGYDLVMPAMVEFTDSLLTGTATSLQRKTFTLVDQVSGRQMGLRSDMTPQVARIDAHQLGAERPISRLCYCGHLVHAQTDGLNPSRSPLQIGAEVFGNASIEADIEVVSLMLETLHCAGLEQVSIDLGHVGIFRSLFEASGLGRDQEQRLFDMLQRKSIPELKEFLAAQDLDDDQRRLFCELALLNGDVSMLSEAQNVYRNSGEDCIAALEHIRSVAEGVQKRFPQLLIHCDLSELRGYEYHTGLVFAAFVPGQGREIARGGRYDDIGSVFGVARPATGFSTDLLTLFQLSGSGVSGSNAVLAPNLPDADLRQLIAELRGQGQRVVIDLSDGALSAGEQSCQQQITRTGEQWVVSDVSQ